MLRYLIRRFLSGLVSLVLFASFLFFAIELALPGDYASQFFGLSVAEKAELRQQLGLDLPLWLRYLHWLGSLLTLNLGRSYRLSGLGEPVTAILSEIVPPTLLVFGIGTWIAFALGLWLGKATSWRMPRVLSGSATLGAIALYTSFPPWLSFLMIYALAGPLGLPPIIPKLDLRGMASVGAPAVMTRMILGLVGVYVILLALSELLRRLVRRPLPSLVFAILLGAAWVGTWHLFGLFKESLAIARGAALPTAVYVLLSFGDIMLIMRTTMADTAFEDYVYAARAKGLRERTVRDRHAARTALLPVMARMVTTLPYLLAGLVMIETSLNWAGLGTSLLTAVGTQDLPLAIGGIMVVGVISLVGRLFLEVAQAVLDPRLRTLSHTAGAVEG